MTLELSGVRGATILSNLIVSTMQIQSTLGSLL